MNFVRTLGITGAAISALVAGHAAQAQTACSVADISPAAQACRGFFSGNLLSNNSADITAQQAALLSLGYTWDGNWNAVEILSPLNGATTVDFTKLLTGTTYIGLHFGNGQGGPGNATAFYRLNAGTGLDTFTLNYLASSNAVLYATAAAAVPEPATWAMMLVGFGMIGAAARYRRRHVHAAITA